VPQLDSTTELQPQPSWQRHGVSSYNSLDRNRSGRFGNGWSFGDWHSVAEESRPRQGLDEGLPFQRTVPVYCLQSNTNKVVSVVFPDGKTYSFQVVSGPECQVDRSNLRAHVSYTGVAGSAGTAGATLVSADGGQAHSAEAFGNWRSAGFQRTNV